MFPPGRWVSAVESWGLVLASPEVRLTPVAGLESTVTKGVAFLLLVAGLVLVASVVVFRDLQAFGLTAAIVAVVLGGMATIRNLR